MAYMNIHPDTQTLLSEKIAAHLKSYKQFDVVKNLKEYNKTKALKYGWNTIWKIQHRNPVHYKTVIDVMELLDLKLDYDAYSNGIIKHLENDN